MRHDDSRDDDTLRATAAAASARPDTQRRRWFTGLAVLGGVGALVAASKSHAMGGWGHQGAGNMDPEEMARRMDWRIGRMVKSVGGTDEQKNKIVAIAKAALADLKPLREQHREARRAGLELLAAPVIDRRALEALRVSQMQLADTLSRRTATAMADAAEVLTPEQRLKLSAYMKQRMDRHRRG